METLEIFGNAKLCFKYSCINCDYNTNKKSSYDNHLLSFKHKNVNKKAYLETKICPKYACTICNKIILESMETDKEKTDKIIKKIAKEVTIDKETL
jgi:hypothetical protein